MCYCDVRSYVCVCVIVMFGARFVCVCYCDVRS